jgi:DNA polymerase elongation subunit (family B)
MNFKSEWVASSGLFVAKKSYAVRLVYQEGILDIERKVVGLTLKKGSTPKAMKEFLSKILDMILDFKDKKEIDAVILDEINKLSEVYDLEDIAIPSSVKDPDSYTTNTIQGRASKIYNKYFCKVPKDKIEGGKIKIFYVKHWKDIPELERVNEYVLALPAKSQMWKSIKDHVELDYVKMKERLIIKPLTGFYKALDWNLPKRLMMTKKKSLFSKILDSNKKEKGDSFE